MATEEMRVERDSLGELRVPVSAYYGVQTMRAQENFPISDLRFPRRFIEALAQIKGTAAQVNRDLGLLDGKTAEQIIGAAQEQAALLLQDQSILREAETRSQDILDKAQTKAEETMHGADQYAADVLVRLDSDLVKTLSVIRKSLEVLEERRAAPTEG